MSKIVYFFDPHPGMLGALAPLPEPVRLLAQDLDGQQLELGDALARIAAIAPHGATVEESAAADAPFSLGESGCILLEVKDGGAVHCWRVLRFKDII